MRMRDELPISLSRMEAAMNLQPHRSHARGDELLIHHCVAISGLGEDVRPPARARLELALGSELAELLVGALTPTVQGLRGSSSP
jgi:hypothetical protein